jgi:Transposase IS66 family
VLSDDAGQFNVGRHALCWIHAERLVHKLDTFTDQHRAAQARVRGRIWRFYASLKAYQLNPTERRSVALRARFDRIFLRRTGFVTLDRLLARLHANKDELLMVLDRPEIPLHTNGSENDIRCYVTRRKGPTANKDGTGLTKIHHKEVTCATALDRMLDAWDKIRLSNTDTRRFRRSVTSGSAA